MAGLTTRQVAYAGVQQQRVLLKAQEGEMCLALLVVCIISLKSPHIARACLGACLKSRRGGCFHTYEVSNDRALMTHGSMKIVTSSVLAASVVPALPTTCEGVVALRLVLRRLSFLLLHERRGGVGYVSFLELRALFVSKLSSPRPFLFLLPHERRSNVCF